LVSSASEFVQRKNYLLATDLDGTLLGSGKKYEDALELFKKALILGSFTLVYVTGRNLQEIQEAVESYCLPLPRAAIAEIGTRIFYQEKGAFTEDTGWKEELQRSAPGWDRKKIAEGLSRLEWLFEQSEEHQNPFKISYYLASVSDLEDRLAQVKEKIEKVCPHFELVISSEPDSELVFLDVVPRRGTKAGALEYLRKKLGFRKNRVIYAGDSGNDLHALTVGYWSVVVKNASWELKTRVREIARKKGISSRIYFARGQGGLDGKYVSGLVEGLVRLKAIPLHLLKECR